MTEAPQNPGFRSQMRELLSKEPVVLAQVTERTLPRFEASLTELSTLCQADGMLPVTGNRQETNEEWVKGTKGLWLVGQKETDFSDPNNAAGFVNVYKPEQSGAISEWLLARGMRAYDPGAILEMSSFVKNNATDVELGANKQALAKVFMDDNFKDVRAVTMWVMHTSENALDMTESVQMKKLGGWPLGSRKYDPSESVDSTCFLITRRAFLDALTGQKRV